jgi:hypothetical protein
LNEWESELRVLADEISEMSDLDVRYTGLTTEANRTEHPGDRPFTDKSDILITIAPADTGIMEDAGDEYFGGTRSWVNGWTNSSVWEELMAYDIQVTTGDATSDLMWPYKRRYLMNFLGNAFGLGDLETGISTEIMSWGSHGSGTASSPDWGPGDRHAFKLLGAVNGCLS